MESWDAGTAQDRNNCKVIMLRHPEAIEAAHIKQIEATMRARGEALYGKVLAANRSTQAIEQLQNTLTDAKKAGLEAFIEPA